MQLHTFIAFLLPILGTVQAGCYSGGASWDNEKGRATATVSAVCYGHIIGGFFNEGQTKYYCVQLTDNKKGEFWVGWKGRGGLTLNDDDCVLRLTNEIGGCSHGGESTIADWYFR